LPRGLGDDPLSRQRKTGKGRAVVPDAPSLKSPTASHYAQSVQSLNQGESVPEAPASEPPSRPYNDVFFQRKSEDLPEQDQTSKPEVSSSATPVAPPAESIVIPQVVSSQSADSTALQGSAAAMVSETEEGTAQSKAEERGFFRRIFGRLGQKSH